MVIAVYLRNVELVLHVPSELRPPWRQLFTVSTPSEQRETFDATQVNAYHGA